MVYDDSDNGNIIIMIMHTFVRYIAIIIIIICFFDATAICTTGRFANFRPRAPLSGKTSRNPRLRSVTVPLDPICTDDSRAVVFDTDSGVFFIFIFFILLLLLLLFRYPLSPVEACAVPLSYCRRRNSRFATEEHARARSQRKFRVASKFRFGVEIK